MNIHQRRALIGPHSPRGKPIGRAGAGSEEPAKVEKNHKTSILYPLDMSKSTIIIITTIIIVIIIIMIICSLSIYFPTLMCHKGGDTFLLFNALNSNIKQMTCHSHWLRHRAVFKSAERHLLVLNNIFSLVSLIKASFRHNYTKLPMLFLQEGALA